MAYTHANWNAQTTNAGKLTELNAYIVELEADVTSASGGGLSATKPIETILTRLYQERERLQGIADRTTVGVISKIAFRKP